ncbi:MAG TPA: hypothetical protein VNL69_00350 [Bacteroidota bacterium]|nr:hypothetical protein [Bacteroidota bacterium]
MNTGFTHEELAVLEDVIKEYLTELRMEIADTDDYEYRQNLKHKAEVLQAIVGKLEKAKISAMN